MNKKVIISISTLLFILIGVGSYFAYNNFISQSTTNMISTNTRRAFDPNNPQAGRQGGQNRPTLLTGIVSDIVDKKVIMDLQDNKGQRIVTTNSNTTYVIQNTGIFSDLKVDDNVQISLNKIGDKYEATTLRYGAIQQGFGGQNPQGNPSQVSNSQGSLAIQRGDISQTFNPIDVLNRQLSQPNPQLNGKIKTITNDKLILSLFTDITQEINIAKDTKFVKITEAKFDDIKKGINVTVSGQDDNTNFTARNILTIR